MLVNLKYKGIKVRRHGSHKLEGDEKFTGTVVYSVIGTLDGMRVRLSLGTSERNAAIRRVAKIERAIAEGSTSLLWAELHDSLPPTTFKLFARRIGYHIHEKRVTSKPTWQDLCGVYELDMERKVANKARGASRKEGIMSDSTRQRYRQTVRHFTAFLEENLPLDSITAAVIEKYKVARHKQIMALKQAHGGASIALDIAVLHGMFNVGRTKKLIEHNPIDFSRESKPGENPKNGARPFNAEELVNLRKHANGDMLSLLLLRWTGLRVQDSINLCWNNIHFNRGTNGEVEVLTQKRSKIAIIPLSSELRIALEAQRKAHKPSLADRVLINPETDLPFVSRKRLYERCKALGVRAGVRRVTPHCFRDTFACDMLARGNGIYDVAKMLADTVETVEKSYAQFVPAARDAAQSKMDNGLGIEERGQMDLQRGQKVVGFPAQMVRQRG